MISLLSSSKLCDLIGKAEGGGRTLLRGGGGNFAQGGRGELYSKGENPRVPPLSVCITATIPLNNLAFLSGIKI